MRTLVLSVLGLVMSAGWLADVRAAENGKMVITGTLTNDGVPCRALRGDDGVLYTFRRTPVVSGFMPGDRVKLEGSVTPISICQQGTTIVVTRAERAE